MQKIIPILLLGLGLVYSQAVLSAEMIRYEHDMYQNKIAKPNAQQNENIKNRKKISKKTVNLKEKHNRAEHPVRVAFPDRN